LALVKNRKIGGLGAAGAGSFGGFCFLEQAGAAETTGGVQIGRQREVGEFGAPAVAFGMAIERRAAFGAELLH